MSNGDADGFIGLAIIALVGLGLIIFLNVSNAIFFPSKYVAPKPWVAPTDKYYPCIAGAVNALSIISNKSYYTEKEMDKALLFCDRYKDE